MYVALYVLVIVRKSSCTRYNGTRGRGRRDSHTVRGAAEYCMVYRDPPRVPLYPVQLDFRTIIVLVGDSKAPGRSLLGLDRTQRERPADFRARERVEATCKSVLWLSWLPHALVSSPNLGKEKVRPPSPCRPSYSTVPFKNCASVRPIFALASGLKQLAKASCGSPGCLTRW